MQLTFVGLNKKSTKAIYSGLRLKQQIPTGQFKDKTPPPTLTIEGEGFAEAAAPKVKLSPEERKARRAARPKLTLEQQIQKLAAKQAKLAAKLAAGNAVEA